MGIREELWPGLTARGLALEVALALFAALGVGVIARDPEDRIIPLPPLFAAAVLLGVAVLLLRRRAPVVPFLLSVALTAAAPAAVIAVPMTSYAVGRHAGRWSVRATAGLAGIVGVMLSVDADTPYDWIFAAGWALLMVVFPAALGAWARTRAHLLIALTERTQRAESERDLLAREAVLTERTRIAREMHDAVGHRVSLMVLQAGAIEMAVQDPARVEQLAGQVQAAGRRALEELRQMVGVLRAEDVDEDAPLGPQPTLDDLPRLVAQAREAGMSVELDGPPEVPVDPAVGRAAYRVAQEALTNAGKHAPGAHIRVAVHHTSGELAVHVVNGPPQRRVDPVPGDGYGLVGLAERVRTLGGRLTAEPRLDGGFLVEAVLPT